MQINPPSQQKPAPPREGYLFDFVSGREVRATPEEVEAVQVFSRLLIEDYGYPVTHIQTRPQYRVKVRPSDNEKEYPVDIAVFTSQSKNEDEEHIIIECKGPNRTEGRSQLENYLTLCKATFGVWFNGEEKVFLRKTERSGRVYFEEIPNIPKYGERIEDVGLYRRSTLKPTHNLKSVFRTIRNHLAANNVGATRDEVLAQQLINLIFCKIYDERFTKPKDVVKFRAGIEENPQLVKTRIQKLFELVKKQYNDVIQHDDDIELDPKSVAYVVGELQMFCVTESERDVVADAFETFIGPSLKGAQGQFFTPRNCINLIMELVSLQATDRVIDPACGSGGFLIESLKKLWREIDLQGQGYDWRESEILAEKQKVAIKSIRGIDKDNFLSKVAKSYMAIMGDGRGGVFCENSLGNPSEWSNLAQEHVHMGSFDVVVTNPPFGQKLKIKETDILSKFRLGHKWKVTKGGCTQLNTLHDGQPPQVLFIERCIELLRPGGRVGIMIPESMLCNPSHSYVMHYLQEHALIRAVISMPEELFQPYTHAKTCVVLIEKRGGKDENLHHDIFMAVARWCGHDSRGLEIPFDDIPKIIENFLAYKKGDRVPYNRLGFVIKSDAILNGIYLPKYYNPEIPQKLSELRATHDLLCLGDLIRSKAIQVNSGHEVGKLAYGTGTIPFVRTSEIANWEIKIDAKHGLDNATYEELRQKQDVQENDILMVRDGTYLVGDCAIVTPEDVKMVFQSHIYKFRADGEEIHPYLLLAVLSSPIVKAQVYAKRFTQDIIDTLGQRHKELTPPLQCLKSQAANGWGTA